MSASLVGSEMCIRDSPPTAEGSPSPGPMSDIPDEEAHEDLTNTLRHCYETLTQLVAEAEETGAEAELGENIGSITQTLGMWQQSMG
eukprot:1113722-Alexandrium_andersonii.AAC.1